MKCKRCNFDNEDDAQKCINCGMKLEPRKDNTKKEEFQKPTVTVEIQSANTQKVKKSILWNLSLTNFLGISQFVVVIEPGEHPANKLSNAILESSKAKIRLVLYSMQ